MSPKHLQEASKNDYVTPPCQESMQCSIVKSRRIQTRRPPHDCCTLKSQKMKTTVFFTFSLIQTLKPATLPRKQG
ncbi:hypothetical protein DUNSADRAFT_6658 [Dunaliella salina]|uniref:Encoded protein n=1 Tax=Dunaliella salina TaxID=3046 RepID=A0ABQ7GMW8_DUNSA|nr:hypothetical protein DUNSADRAFT_6658 [Dunaliella salina]|eukprot:KAF5835947.1 hypothetical protein DUNSADRAFT_6658 [Dunaliella salina]